MINGNSEVEFIIMNLQYNNKKVTNTKACEKVREGV